MTTSYDGAALVLWDVDHTLVSISGVSRSLYAHAFQTVTGQPMRELAVMTGRTERAIIDETLKLNGIENSDSLLDDFYIALGEAAEQLQDRIRDSGKALPGTAQALAAVADSHAVQSVVTGNIRGIAITKLRVFDLADRIDFSVGGYGDDGSDRADLVRLARSRAEAKYCTSFAVHRTFVIGDTLHDIKGAHDAGVRAIGVATGGSTVSDLKAAGADIVLSDLTEIGALSAAIGGEV